MDDRTMLELAAKAMGLDSVMEMYGRSEDGSIYTPCQRKDTPHVPVKAIGPTNFAFYGIVETNEEFAERAGTQVKEVEE